MISSLTTELKIRKLSHIETKNVIHQGYTSNIKREWQDYEDCVTM